MIYLPNPKFQCDVSAGGGEVAHSPPFKPTTPAEKFLMHKSSMLVNIDVNKLNSKFEKAKCNQNTAVQVMTMLRLPDVETLNLFGFVREDGCEFGIGPVRQQFRWEFWGFWNIPFHLSPSDWQTFGLTWIPTHTVEFLQWVEKECPIERFCEFGPVPQF